MRNKVVCTINTPTHKKGELVDRFDLEVDRLDYPDMYQKATKFDLIADFHKKFKVQFENNFHLRFDLLREENEEYLEACKAEDRVEMFDAIIDSLFIVYGTAHYHGFTKEQLEQGFLEVYNSNLSKLDENGEPIINGENGILDLTRPLGKILKGSNFKEPNLKQFLDEK